MGNNKYKKLITNTLVFAIGSFGSKLMIFLLVPLYTSVLLTSEYGTATLVSDTANMILPIVSVSMYHAIIRYGLDKATKKSDVFSVALIVNMIGFGVFILLYPVIKYVIFVGKFAALSEYIILLYLYVFMSSMNSLCASFVRANGQVKLFSVDGIFNTLCLIILNILFLLVFKIGITGYILSTVLADGLSVCFLFAGGKLWKYVRFNRIRRGTFRKMLRFSIPMIPNSLFWWVTNLSDRYMITGYIGSDANGIYSAAAKLPNMINTVSGIFTQAWQMSAITEYDQNDRRFYANVFSVYQTVIFLSGAFIILLTKPIISVWLDSSYYTAWQYVPFLVISVVFSCFAGFYSSIYMALKRNIRSMLTTMFGAAVNITMNIVLIPKIGIQGAAISTFVSYLLVYAARAFDISRIYRFNNSSRMVAINTFLIIAETIALLYIEKNFIIVGSAVFLIMLFMNSPQIIRIISQFLRALKKRSAGKRKNAV